MADQYLYIFSSFTSSILTAAYRRHEQEKRRSYEERVRGMEHGCFTPLVWERLPLLYINI